MKNNSNKTHSLTISIILVTLGIISLVENNQQQTVNGLLLTKDQRYSLGALDACDSINFGYISIDNPPPTNKTIGDHHSQAYLDGFHSGLVTCGTAYKRGYTPVEIGFRHPLFQTDEESSWFQNHLNPGGETTTEDIIKDNYTITH
jgi:hypothetical protein